MFKDNSRKHVFFIILVITIFVISTCIYIAFIWSNNEITFIKALEKGNSDSGVESDEEYKLNYDEINKYTDSSSVKNGTDISNTYFSELEELLKEENYDLLFQKMNSKYLTENNFNKETLKNYLITNNLIGNQIKMISLEKSEQENDTYVYRIKYKVKFYIGYVNLIETTPYEYTIDFNQETIPTIISHRYTRTVDNIKFEIDEIKRTSNSLTYKIKITNNNEEKIEFNFNSISNVGLSLNDGGIVKQTSTVLSNDNTTISKESYLVRKMYFPINMQYQNQVKGFVFYDVKIGNTTKNIYVDF